MLTSTMLTAGVTAHFVHPYVNVLRCTNSRANLFTIREIEHYGAHFPGGRNRIQ